MWASSRTGTKKQHSSHRELDEIKPDIAALSVQYRILLLDVHGGLVPSSPALRKAQSRGPRIISSCPKDVDPRISLGVCSL
ncbi:hypothetical protein K3495_g13793 [Podosphaera aphanis]|nr:hypothetical protein K3495_g13793 [Podosphaera aphanis]